MINLKNSLNVKSVGARRIVVLAIGCSPMYPGSIPGARFSFFVYFLDFKPIIDRTKITRYIIKP